MNHINASVFDKILTHGLSLGIIILDQNYRIIQWNQWMEKHTGIKKSDIIGNDIFEKYPEIRERNKAHYITDSVKKKKSFILSPFIHHYLIPLDIIKNGEPIRMYQDVKIYPFADDDKSSGAIIIIKDLTEQILYEKEILRLNRILKGIRNVNQLITRVKTEQELTDCACKILVEDIGYRFAWIGFVKKEAGSSPSLEATVYDVIPVSCAGIMADTALLKDHWSKFRDIQDINQHVIKTGKIHISNDVQKNPPFRHCHLFAEKKGCESVCSLPIKSDNRIIGIMNICAGEKNIFHSEELELLEEVTSDISFAVTMLRDREKRRHAEKEVKNSERNMRLIIESSPVGIWITKDNRCIYANPAFVRMFGYESRIDITGLSVENLFISDDAGVIRQMILQSLKNKDHLSSHEVKAKSREGKTFDVSVWMALITYENEPAILGFAVDISSEKKLREQLRQAHKMEAIGTLAGGIAHDFNNILYPIMGYAEITIAEKPDESIIIRNMQEILKAVDRAKGLVNQILSFVRPAKQERRAVHIYPVIKETLQLIRASIPSTVEIRQNINKNSGLVIADPVQIHQIMINLCTNAYHSMREKGGVLEVILEDAAITENDPDVSPGNYVRLTVKDTGHGMEQSVMERIFDPYFTTKPQGEGTGMGLTIVHGIVKSHGGYITVQSKPGQGAAFHIYLPSISETDTGDIKIILNKRVPKGNEKILLVDDEEQNVNMLKQMLKGLGYHVTAGTGSLKILEIFREKPENFDLIITDQTMPAMTGIQLAQEIIKIRPDIPIILCTGFSELVTEDTAKSSGISEYVMKPVTRNEIAVIIRKVLDQ